MSRSIARKAKQLNQFKMSCLFVLFDVNRLLIVVFNVYLYKPVVKPNTHNTNASQKQIRDFLESSISPSYIRCTKFEMHLLLTCHPHHQIR